MFNRLSKANCMPSSCSVAFKSQLVDFPCQLGYNNGLDGEDCLHGGHYADDIAAN